MRCEEPKILFLANKKNNTHIVDCTHEGETVAKVSWWRHNTFRSFSRDSLRGAGWVTILSHRNRWHELMCKRVFLFNLRQMPCVAFSSVLSHIYISRLIDIIHSASLFVDFISSPYNILNIRTCATYTFPLVYCLSSSHLCVLYSYRTIALSDPSLVLTVGTKLSDFSTFNIYGCYQQKAIRKRTVVLLAKRHHRSWLKEVHTNYVYILYMPPLEGSSVSCWKSEPFAVSQDTSYVACTMPEQDESLNRFCKHRLCRRLNCRIWPPWFHEV